MHLQPKMSIKINSIEVCNSKIRWYPNESVIELLYANQTILVPPIHHYRRMMDLVGLVGVQDTSPAKYHAHCFRFASQESRKITAF